jgi:hypothetical protein
LTPLDRALWAEAKKKRVQSVKDALTQILGFTPFPHALERALKDSSYLDELREELEKKKLKRRL